MMPWFTDGRCEACPGDKPKWDKEKKECTADTGCDAGTIYTYNTGAEDPHGCLPCNATTVNDTKTNQCRSCEALDGTMPKRNGPGSCVASSCESSTPRWDEAQNKCIACENSQCVKNTNQCVECVEID